MLRQSHKRILAAGLGLVVMMGLLPGCAMEPERAVPPTAMLSEEGNERLVYTAPTDGMAYVYDETSGELVYSENLHQGQRLTIDPGKDQIELDGQVVFQEILHSGDQYQIYFDQPLVETDLSSVPSANP